jgi:protein-S-isoprenylcysteine O-methyltransferase Ste14
MSHATEPARLPRSVQRPQRARVPALIILASAPVMTAGHLLFAAAATGYILAGIAFEEHDLIQGLGGTYATYRAGVPALIPRPWLRRPPAGS